MPLVAFLVVFGVVFAFVYSKRKPGSPGLRSGRLHAHGLVLSASSYPSGERTQWGQKFELRDLVLDVEIPGQEPYEIACTPLIPRICDGRPGARLDLSVHPRRPNDIVILGPAGSSGWLADAPWITSPVTLQGVPRPGSERLIVSLFAGGMMALLAAGFVAVLTAHKESSGTTEQSPTSRTLSRPCESALRCCRVVGGSTCSQFATMDTPTCVQTLQVEQVAATRAQKQCP